jgi:DNA primase
LLSHPQRGAAAREYLKSRGFSDESVKRFQIGLAADSWDTLLKSDVLRKFPAGILATAGLVRARDTGGGTGHYDTFRNRLMFPIRDEAGRVIAFGGRAMPGSNDPAKYLNSPETPLFSKSRAVYGLDFARQKIVETRTVAVVEGYTDVVMAHQFGATNVVSILGTAMTEQHVSILRRFADKIVLLFDADSAGDAAVDRTVELFLTQPIEIAIASMPEGVDPDEFLLANGTEEFQRLLSTSQDALTYKWKRLVRQFGSEDDLTARQKAVRDYLDLLAGARGSGPIDPIRWGQALSRVSRLTEMPVDELNRMFRVHKPLRQPAAEARARTASVRNEANPAQLRAQRWIIGVLLNEPNRWVAVQKHVDLEDFVAADERLRRIAKVFWAYQRDEGEPVLNEFLSLLDEPAKELAVELVQEVEAMADLERTLNGAIEHLEQQRLRDEQRKLVAELRRTGEQNEKTNEDENGGEKDRKADVKDEVALLKQLQEQARRPDLGRV